MSDKPSALEAKCRQVRVIGVDAQHVIFGSGELKRRIIQYLAGEDRGETGNSACDGSTSARTIDLRVAGIPGDITRSQLADDYTGGAVDLVAVGIQRLKGLRRFASCCRRGRCLQM
jgi:hypothetical protein